MKYFFLYTLLLITFLSCSNSSKNNISDQNPIVNANDSSIIRTEVIDLDTGWGYAIYKNEKLFIYQTAIPAVNGRFLFSTPQKAQITADFVAYKMSIKSGLPSVTIQELDSLGVLDPKVKKFQAFELSTDEGVSVKNNN